MNKLDKDRELHQDAELDFRKDWKESLPLLRQAIEQAPIVGCILFISLAITLPKLAPCMIFIQSLACLFLATRLIRATYCQIVPQAQVYPDLFPQKRELSLIRLATLFLPLFLNLSTTQTMADQICL